jgi:hypothetical protein
MPAAYLDWLTDLFEEAQVPFNAETSAYIDTSLRKLVGAPTEDEEIVYRRLRERWLKHGLPGRQLLGGLLRDEVFSRRDSPMRPHEGGGYYTNDYVQKQALPDYGHRRH